MTSTEITTVKAIPDSAERMDGVLSISPDRPNFLATLGQSPTPDGGDHCTITGAPNDSCSGARTGASCRDPCRYGLHLHDKPTHMQHVLVDLYEPLVYVALVALCYALPVRNAHLACVR